MDEVTISRRTIMRAGVATGVVLGTGSSKNAIAKSPAEPGWTPEFTAAFDFATKKNFKSSRGYWAVAYPDDNFAGDPFLVGTPVMITKPQAGTMPAGWGSKAGSIVVGPATVLRLIHKVNGQDSHVTLLPWESMAQIGAIGIVDGQSSWKLYPAGDLRPPY